MARTDTILFGQNNEKDEHPTGHRQGLAKKFIAVLTPVFAVGSIGLHGLLKSNAAPKNTSHTSTSSAARTTETATPPAETAFYQGAMDLNETASPAAPAPAGTPPPPAETVFHQGAMGLNETASPAAPAPAEPVPAEPAPPPADPAPPPPPAVAPQEWVKLMSQNVWGMYHDGAKEDWKERIDQVATLIKDNQAEFVTLQEGRLRQIDRVISKLDNRYNMYPGMFVNAEHLSHRTIIYKATDDNGAPLWGVAEGGKLNLPDYDDKNIDQPSRAMPWGRFIHAQTGQEIVIISVHPVAFAEKKGALKRERAGQALAEWARTMKATYPRALVVISGDINTTDEIRDADQALKGDRNRLIPCIIGPELRAIDDLAEGRVGACPPSSDKIDQMFTNSEGAGNIRYIDKGQSDHPAVLADVKLRP